MFYAVIMAGGSGARLWPLSRRRHSKQSLRLIGDRSMFQQVVYRLAPLFRPGQIFVVTRQDQSALLTSQTPELPAANFIKEPFGRGTAPAIGLAAIRLMQDDPTAIMAILTADHYIANPERFCQVLALAFREAEKGYLVTLGIKPVDPSTAFGYIEQGQLVDTLQNLRVFRVKRFIEKPMADAAKNMIASGNLSWNSGMFIWRADRILEEFKLQMPEFYAQLMEVKDSLGRQDSEAELERIWSRVSEQTIDYGVMEHARDTVVIPVDIGWTDVGSWESLSELLPHNEEGNTFIGPCEEIDTQNTLVFGGKRLVATIGIKDMVIVDSEDALLVCAKKDAQEVRQIVDRLKVKKEDRWL